MFLGNKDLEAYKKDYSRWGIRAPKLVTLLSKQKEANFQRNRVWPSITKIRSELAITAVLNAVQVSADSDVAFQTLLSVALLLWPSSVGCLACAREIPALWSFLSYYCTKNSNWVKKWQVKQRLFITPCTWSVSAESGAAGISSDTMFCTPPPTPIWHQTVSAATGVRQIVWRGRENTCRDRASVSLYQHKGRALLSTRAGPGSPAWLAAQDLQPGHVLAHKAPTGDSARSSHNN